MALVTTERKEVLVHATALATLEHILVRERSQAGKDETTRFHLYRTSRMACLKDRRTGGGERDGRGCSCYSFFPETVKTF